MNRIDLSRPGEGNGRVIYEEEGYREREKDLEGKRG